MRQITTRRLAETSKENSEEPEGPDQTHPDFGSKCEGITRTLLKNLGPDAVWFDHPVEVEVLPDYYDVIDNSMDLGTILGKLEGLQYAAPDDFYQVRLGWPDAPTQPL